MKPAYEPILCFRKPRPGTYADCALEHGTGALNIDGCRIGTESTERTANKPGVLHYGGSNHRPHHDGPAHHRTTGGTSGRFPANLLLSHEPECRRVGSKRVRGERIGYRGNGGMWGSMPADKERGHDYADADGLETVEAWECVPWCAVRLLAEQTEDSRAGKPSGTGQPRGDSDNPQSMFGNTGRINAHARHDDTATAGAARFFYQAKASRAEREQGLIGHIPCLVCGELDTEYHMRNGKQERCRRCGHPTVKPIDLCRYLATLIRPPEAYLDDAALLVPYAGTMSEAIGAMLAGWRNITAIEIDPESVAIGKARVAWWSRMHELIGETDGKALLKAARKIEKEGAVQVALEV